MRHTYAWIARLLASRAIGAAKAQPLVPCESQSCDLEVLAHLTGGVKRRHLRGASSAASTPGLTVPEWHGLYPPSGEVPRELLTRHILAVGETGSGNTASAILPVLAAMARAPRGRVGAALVIDPKRGFGPVFEHLVPARLRRLSASTCVLNGRRAKSLVPRRRPQAGTLPQRGHQNRAPHRFVRPASLEGAVKL